MKRNHNIAIVSLDSGGTMGHMSLTTKLSESLSKKNNIFLFSDHDYSDFSRLRIRNFIKLPKQKHTKSIGGCINYKYKKFFIDQVKKNNINVVIFSTFYDIDLLDYLKKLNIKTLLISYPLRDTHRQVIKIRKFNNHFDKIFTLSDITCPKKIFPNEEIVSYFEEKNKSKKIKHDKRAWRMIRRTDPMKDVV